jgi:sugar/nucleoside kinase (ribokinase family)
MFDLITVGDATIDTFIKIHDATVKCDLNNENCQICLNFADKIPVDAVEHQVAGNAANNAVGSSRLGLKTAIYVNVGSDDSGYRIKKTLASEKVDPTYIKTHEGMESNYSAVINFQGERTILVYHQDWKYELPKLDPSKRMYLTSLSKSYLEYDLVTQMVDYLKLTEAKLTYNPGTYQLNADVKKDVDLLKLTEVFIVNKEEARKILEIPTDSKSDFKELLVGLKALGPKNVIITDGRNGSVGTDGDRFYKIPEWPGERIEATGAGDSYATGATAALFFGEDLGEAMIWGAINGASVAHETGPQKGLLTLEEMKKRRATIPDFKVENI